MDNIKNTEKEQSKIQSFIEKANRILNSIDNNVDKIESSMGKYDGSLNMCGVDACDNDEKLVGYDDLNTKLNSILSRLNILENQTSDVRKMAENIIG